MGENIIQFPPAGPRLLCTIAITKFPDGTIRAGFEHMPVQVIEDTGIDVADRVRIAAGWILDAAADMERQAEMWAAALYGDEPTPEAPLPPPPVDSGKGREA